MISIIGYLFESDSTKLSKGEKVVGGAAVVGGLGASAVGLKKAHDIVKDRTEKFGKNYERLYNNYSDAHRETTKKWGGLHGLTPMWKKGYEERSEALKTASKKLETESIADIEKAVSKPLKTAELGAGTAAIAGGVLAARKLYQMYKNKKK